MKGIVIIFFIFSGFLFQKETKIHTHKVLAEEYSIIKIKKEKNIYIIYAIKNSEYYKIVSLISRKKCCSKIKVGKEYSLELQSIFYPNTQHYLGGMDYYGTTIELERDSICDIFFAKNLEGLCYTVPERD